MNFLAHAYLSFNDPEILAGNLAGDFFKGRKILETIPFGIKKGALLHRFIDDYTDRHPSIQRAKIWFRPVYGLYAGAIVDIVMDHFLANDPARFSSDDALLTFTVATYTMIAEQVKQLPVPFQNMFPYMRASNWLYGYKKVSGIEKSLQGLSRRAKYIPDTKGAYKLFIQHYYYLNQCYLELMDPLISAVKLELSKDHP